MTDIDTVRASLQQHNQEHLLQFWGRLGEGQRSGLLAQLESLDLAAVDRMAAMLREPPSENKRPTIEPAEVLELSEEQRLRAREAGEEALRAGRVGVLLVAGGQGSRLGYDGPKGCFPIGPVTHAPLFSVHARKILALEKTCKTKVPFYIMTSEANDAPTRKFFRKHGNFGLAASRAMFFKQGMWPALTPDGRVVLEAPDRLFMSPDGHGGILAALRRNGMLADMAERGLETLFYFQVDNPLVEIADPAFLGVHLAGANDVSVKVCEKRDPDEGLGVIALVNGRSAIVEYTELTREQKHERLPNGRLRFRYGSVAIHVFSLDFLKRMAETDLPLHIAHKKVPVCDDSGKPVTPDKPNAYKFEKFIFDVLPMAARTANLAFRREDEFSPVKNASGSDSPDMARRDMTLKAARWLESAGVNVPRGQDGTPLHPIEIDPVFASSPEQLAAKVTPDFNISGPLFLQ
jgi:UDP-N-acetylglucosamine/UDP-N-acetylgalactosamine diphosphorylase